MLPFKNRLTKKRDFDTVFKKGKTIKTEVLVCKTLKSRLPESRFGFVVSKKVSNKATVRNLVKRRLRKTVADILPKMPQSIDGVIIALPGIEKKKFKELQGEINKLLKI